jgi:hypothetical protein
MTNQFSDFLKKGKEVESDFASLFKNTVAATKHEDMFKKFDLTINIKVDVKGMKKINRSDKEPNENFHWVELKNVRGNKGWLYGGSDYFAFEVKDYFIAVKKEVLQELIKDKITDEEGKGIYLRYSRAGREDLMTLVPTMDLCSIAHAIIPKRDQND